MFSSRRGEKKKKVDFSHKKKVKAVDEFQRAEKNSIPLALIIGEDELKNGLVKVKDIREGDKDKGTPIPRSELAEGIRARLKPVSA